MCEELHSRRQNTPVEVPLEFDAKLKFMLPHLREIFFGGNNNVDSAQQKKQKGHTTKKKGTKEEEFESEDFEHEGGVSEGEAEEDEAHEEGKREDREDFALLYSAPDIDMRASDGMLLVIGVGYWSCMVLTNLLPGQEQTGGSQSISLRGYKRLTQEERSPFSHSLA